MDLLQKTSVKLKFLAGKEFAEKKYLVGVSGGKDSMCLLHLLAQLLSKENLKVLHVNYKLREKESDKDERLVRLFCKKHQIVFINHSPKIVNKSELHLRDVRRDFFNAQLKQTRFDYLVLAHHAQDQLETLLMRMIRGTGTRGLGGIKEKNAHYLRPLLEITPEEIAAYLRVNRIKYRTDQSNYSTDYFRNEIRHEVIPAVEKAADRHGGKTALYHKISSLCGELQTTSKYLDKRYAKVYAKHVSENEFWFRFNRGSFLKLNRLEQQAIIFLALQRLQIVADRKTIERAIGTIETGKEAHLIGGIVLSVSCGQVFLQNKDQRQSLSKVRSPLSLDASLKIPAGLELRFPKPGDRFRSGKLKKRLLEERIPKLMRRILPVLAHCGTPNVVWYLKKD